MPNLYDVLSADTPQVNLRDTAASSPTQPPKPKPGTHLTASAETIDNDCAGMLLGAVSM